MKIQVDPQISDRTTQAKASFLIGQVSSGRRSLPSGQKDNPGQTKGNPDQLPQCQRFTKKYQPNRKKDQRGGDITGYRGAAQIPAGSVGEEESDLDHYRANSNPDYGPVDLAR